MEFRKLFFQVVLMVAVALGLYIAANIGISYQTTSSAQLEKLWAQDIQNLSLANKLPPFWNEIRIVEKNSEIQDPISKTWAENVSLPVEINPQGEYKMEILFLSQKNELGQTRAIIQHHIIHVPSNNSVWELARDYSLK